MKNEFQSKLPKYVKQPSFLLVNKGFCTKSTFELIQLENNKKNEISLFVSSPLK